MNHAKLSDVADVIRGVTFSKADASTEPADGQLPVLRAGNIGDELLLEDDLIYLDRSKIKKNQLLRRGDIVICTSSGSASVVGKSAMLSSDWKGTFGAFCATVRMDGSRAYPSYISHYLRSPAFRNWASGSSGIGIKNIRSSELQDFKIPLPPLNEQKRIAAILDQADELRRLRKRSIDRLNELGQAIFHQMFGNLGDALGVPIGDCVEPIQTWSPARDSEHGTFQYIDISSVSQDEKKITLDGEIPASEAPSRARQLVRFGDVIVSTVRPNLNAVALVPIDMDAATASTGFCVLRPDNRKLTGEYLFHWVRSPRFISNMVNQATGQSYPAVSDKIIKRSEIPIAPIALQRDFQARIFGIQSALNTVIPHREKLESLFSSLQRSAFRGEL